jgi:hypothetical protein
MDLAAVKKPMAARDSRRVAERIAIASPPGA